jgi:NAD(P)-dependent dehydrogenase (short-subunit alcohol dehydrogenase family)
MRMTGKLVLVTGAGHGLGRAIAIEFANAGARVLVTDYDASRAEIVAAEINKFGGSAFGFALDVTSEEQVREVRVQAHAIHGPIDVLVNNAGVVFGGPFLSVPLERHRRTVAINLDGVLTLTHAFLGDLISRSEARIVNIASAAAVLPLPFATSYAASKWGVLGFTESLREELWRDGHRHVRITAICPSYISTGLFDGARPARLTSLLTPESVARSVRWATERGTSFVMLPRTAGLLYSVLRLLPRSMFVRVGRWLGVSKSMVNWRGHSPDVK